MHTFAFNLITPQATFFSGAAREATAPGADGEFGVLAGHMPFISTLKPGIVTVVNAEEAVTRIAVFGGIAEVNPVSCTILAEHAEDLKEVSREQATARLAKAKATLENIFEDEDRTDAERELIIAEAIAAAVA